MFSLLNLFFSIEAKDERESAFSLGTFSDRTFLLMAGLSLLLAMLHHRGAMPGDPEDHELDESQWLLCAGVALSIVAVSEIRKAVLRRRGIRSAAS